MSFEPTPQEIAIRDWVEMVLQGEDPTAKAVYEHGNGPRPAGSYATIQVLTDPRAAQPVKQTTNTPGVAAGTVQHHIHSHRVGTVAIKIYGQNNRLLAMQLALAQADPLSQEFFDSTGVRVLAPLAGLPDTWTARQTKWEGFTPIDFQFTYGAQRTVDLYTIDEVVVTET